MLKGRLPRGEYRRGILYTLRDEENERNRLVNGQPFHYALVGYSRATAGLDNRNLTSVAVMIRTSHPLFFEAGDVVKLDIDGSFDVQRGRRVSEVSYDTDGDDAFAVAAGEPWEIYSKMLTLI